MSSFFLIIGDASAKFISKLKSPDQSAEFFSFLEVGKASVTNRRRSAGTLPTRI